MSTWIHGSTRVKTDVRKWPHQCKPTQDEVWDLYVTHMSYIGVIYRSADLYITTTKAPTHSLTCGTPSRRKIEDPPVIGGVRRPPYYGYPSSVFFHHLYACLHARALISIIQIKSVWSKDGEGMSRGSLMWRRSIPYSTSTYKYPPTPSLDLKSWHIGVNHSLVALAKLCCSVMRLGREWGSVEKSQAYLVSSPSCTSMDAIFL
jgi:hypothetical protein